jgi:hypothetical protein
MVNEKESQDKRDRAYEHEQKSVKKPLLFTAGGDAVDEYETANQTECEQHKTKKSLWQKVRSKSAPFWQAVFTALAFFALLAYTIYTRQQWITLDRSVADNEKQFKQTLCQMQAQTGAQERYARASEDTAASIVDQFRLEERPYVWARVTGGYEGPDGNYYVLNKLGDNKTDVSIAVRIANAGHSPAIDVIDTPSYMAMGPAKKVERWARNFVPPYPNVSSGSVIAPGDHPVTVPTGKLHPLADKELKLVNDGTWEIFVVGRVKYSDIFLPRQKIPYETTYCARYNPTGGLAIGLCPWGQSMR